MQRARLLVLLSIAIFASPLYAADTLRLMVQPVLNEAQTRKAFAPLAAFLANVSGRPVEIVTAPNFLAYWDRLSRHNYDLALDAAHFTDWRVQKFGFDILGKVPGTVSYSLITLDDNPILDPNELIARRVATLGSPSIGAARLNALFPNPVRKPLIMEVDSAEQGVEWLAAKKVDAAILPTPLVSQEMARRGNIAVVLTTDPIPHIALSASPRLAATLRDNLRRALLAAHRSPEGKAMLKKIGFERFDAATPSVYAGQANILKEYWGF